MGSGGNSKSHLRVDFAFERVLDRFGCFQDFLCHEEIEHAERIDGGRISTSGRRVFNFSAPSIAIEAATAGQSGPVEKTSSSRAWKSVVTTETGIVSSEKLWGTMMGQNFCNSFSPSIRKGLPSVLTSLRRPTLAFINAPAKVLRRAIRSRKKARMSRPLIPAA